MLHSITHTQNIYGRKKVFDNKIWTRIETLGISDMRWLQYKCSISNFQQKDYFQQQIENIQIFYTIRIKVAHWNLKAIKVKAKKEINYRIGISVTEKTILSHFHSDNFAHMDFSDSINHCHCHHIHKHTR